jgi:uncharacterized membrane protein
MSSDTTGQFQNKGSENIEESSSKTENKDEGFANNFIQLIRNIASDTAKKITKEEVRQYIENDTEGIKRDIKDITNDLVKESEDKLDKKIDDSRTKTIETLGIFVALFTFVSLEFRAFTMFQSFSAISAITLIILGGLILFIIILDLVIKATDSIFCKIKTLPMFLFLTCFIFLFSGIFLLSDLDINDFNKKIEVDSNSENILNSATSTSFNK